MSAKMSFTLATRPSISPRCSSAWIRAAVSRMAVMEARIRWLAQMMVLTPIFRNAAVGVP
jgi:hypothetical protein